MVRDAVAAGVSPEDALLMASLHPAQWHRLRHHGAIAPGYVADLLLLPDLEGFMPDIVLKRGVPIGEIPPAHSPDWVRQTVRIKPVTASDFAIPWRGGAARTIGLVDDQVVTESLVREPTVVDGHAVADAGADLVKIAVVERHLATGRIGLGLVAGSGLRRGALASTVAHDAHNLVVVGASDEDIAYAVGHLAATGGGGCDSSIGRLGFTSPLHDPLHKHVTDWNEKQVKDVAIGAWDMLGRLAGEMPHLAQLTTLKELHLAATKVTDAGMEHLRNLPRLEEPEGEVKDVAGVPGDQPDADGYSGEHARRPLKAWHAARDPFRPSSPPPAPSTTARSFPSAGAGP
jgi:adenine deaminase